MTKKPLIAVINDDPAFLEFIASFLEDETNFQTVVWDDGVDSLPKLRDHLPDLVILDVRLGDQVVGHDILSEMRQDDQLASIPVIVCTADTQFLNEHCDLLESLRADYLEKPFDLEVLEQKVFAAISDESSRTGEPDLVD